jgi:hypothetical protein
MNNQLPMFVNGASAMKNSVQNDTVGISSEKLDESQLNSTLFSYVAKKKSAPVPTGTVGECNTLRKRILQLSLFPDIYDKRANSRHPGNVDFGEAHY